MFSTLIRWITKAAEALTGPSMEQKMAEQTQAILRQMQDLWQQNAAPILDRQNTQLEVLDARIAVVEKQVGEGKAQAAAVLPPEEQPHVLAARMQGLETGMGAIHTQRKEDQKAVADLVRWKEQFTAVEGKLLQAAGLGRCPGVEGRPCGKLYSLTDFDNDHVVLGGVPYCHETCLQTYLQAQQKAGAVSEAILSEIEAWLRWRGSYAKWLAMKEGDARGELHAKERHQQYVRPYRLWLFMILPQLEERMEKTRPTMNEAVLQECGV